MPHWSTAPWPEQLHRPGERALKNPSGMLRRSDPYYSEMFPHGASAAWDTIEAVRRRAESTSFRAPDQLMDRDVARRFVAEGPSRSQRMALLSILDSWGTATAEQVVALTGHRSLLDVSSKQYMSLFSSGLLDLGKAMRAFGDVRNHPRDALIRHRAPRGQVRRIAGEEWTSAEYLQVDYGVNFQPPMGGRVDRHNVLGLELALRCAEAHEDTSMIFGEKWASGDSFLPKTRKKVGFNRRSEQYPVRGDGTIVLRNGLRVVFELTSRFNETIQRKLQRWARFFAQHPLSESGVVVVFVTASPARDRNRSIDASHNELRTQIKAALRRYSGRDRDSPSARIGMMKWTDLFPAPHEVSDQFESLAAEFATTGWEPKPLMEIDPGFDDEVMHSAPLRHGPVLAATPHWWRRGDHTAMISLPSHSTGIGALDPERHLYDFGNQRPVNPPRRLCVIGAKRPLHSASDAELDPGTDTDDEQAAELFVDAADHSVDDVNAG